ncbi:MAG TPA: metallophosphoesterase family protein [Xanthobacteraceae bacterium]|nr:metallophosphoesterase family protein [Xanthobacteraceae bacterium]
MLIALFADIHGNREAFAACLAHAQEQAVGRIIFLGDYVGYGADPAWVVDEVMTRVGLGARAIMGNHDDAISTPSEHMNPVAAAAIDWTRTQLDRRQRNFLQNLPLSFAEDDRLFVHANAWAPARWGYIIDRSDAARSLRATEASTTFCGHVHVPAVYGLTAAGEIGALTPASGVALPLDADRRWLAVIGSVGQPRDYNPAACYALFDDERAILTYVRVPYDCETAAQKIRNAGLPAILADRLGHGL